MKEKDVKEVKNIAIKHIKECSSFIALTDGTCDLWVSPQSIRILLTGAMVNIPEFKEACEDVLHAIKDHSFLELIKQQMANLSNKQ